MTISKIHLSVTTLVCLLVHLPALAQDSDTKKSATVEFRVTRFDPSDRESPVFRAGSPSSQIEIKVPLTFIEGPFKAPLRDGTTLDLWQGDAKKPVISLEIAPTERQHLLLVFFQQDETFRVLKVHAPPNRIKGGDRFMINATPNEMAIKLGNAEPLMVAASKTGLLAGPPGKEIVSLPVLISLKQEDEWKLASTEQWPCDPRTRKFIVAYMSPRTRQLIFHSVTDPIE
jgi:hypothetical protein